jgi:2'-5' RNA ligase
VASTLRTFIALALEEPALGAATRCLVALREGPLGAAARFVRPEGLHVTLRFLGAIDSELVPSLARAVAEAVAPIPPFALHLGALQIFPSARRPRVLALGLEPESPLAALAAAVERGVVAAGIAPDARAFRPHVTLARVREGRPFAMDGAQGPDAAEFTARAAILFESRPGPGGSVYTPLERMSLGGPVSKQP